MKGRIELIHLIINGAGYCMYIPQNCSYDIILSLISMITEEICKASL